MRKLAIRDQNEYNIDIGMSGCGCTLVIIYGNLIFHGFVGDNLVCLSKMLTATSDLNTTNNDMILTKPFHLPTEEKEQVRIYRRKGEIRG